MARIVYGVSGEGSGHSSRAREMATHLLENGHQVKIVSYDRGYRNLSPDFDVFETEGLHIASSDNRVSAVKTFTHNIGRLGAGHKKARIIRRDLFKEFAPDIVITDFEPMTAYFANHYGIPLITIDNQHRIRYMKYRCPSYLKADQVLTETIVRTMVPHPDISLVITFYHGEAKNNRTFFFPPILRKEVLDLAPRNGSSILVYLTSGFESFLDYLGTFARERFIVYGYDRGKTAGNITFKPFSRTGFLQDLAECKAVIATAGFTLMTESLHLRKPYCAMPMRGQFEQELNGMFLKLLDYGMNMRRISREQVAAFLYHIPDYRARLKRYPASDNTQIKAKLDELLADGCALAREYRRQRKAGKRT